MSGLLFLGGAELVKPFRWLDWHTDHDCRRVVSDNSHVQQAP